MHPSLALGWPLWRRHRWGMLVALGCVVASVVVSMLLPAHVSPSAAPSIFGPILLLIPHVALYLFGVFSYGFDANDVNGRQSCFPARLFTLPVRTEALVGWPMAYGAAAVAVLWFITGGLIMRPWFDLSLEAVAPLWWPAMLAVASLAWVQALLWTPFGLPWLRVILLVLLLATMIAVLQFSVLSGASEAFLLVLLTPLAMAGWIVGYFGVKKARRGDVPDWEGIFRPLSNLAQWLPRRRRSFASAAQAQVWFEWRCTGNSLPIMTALVLPFVLLFFALGENDVMSTSHILLSALAVPVFLAALAGMTGHAKNPSAKEYHAMAPFTATLPLTSADLVGARLKMAALSTLTAWLILLVALPLTLMLAGRGDEVAGWWRQAVHDHHPVKVVAGMAAVAIVLLVWTWKRHVDGIFAGLAGIGNREWIVGIIIMAGFFGSVVLAYVAAWIYKSPDSHATVLAVLPWLLALFILGRLLVAGWALRQVLRRGLLEARTAGRWVASWLLLASFLFGLLAWVVPSGLVPLYYLAFAVLIAMPMARLAASPLVLAWNRHR